MIQKFFSTTRKCLCAFCGSPRQVNKKRHLTWINVLYSALLSGILMLILWQGLDGRVFLLFVMNLLVAEAFVQTRWRLSLPCPHCGFDAVLYMQSPERAAERVRQFHDRQRQRADYYLRRPSPLEESRRAGSKGKPKMGLPSGQKLMGVPKGHEVLPPI